MIKKTVPVIMYHSVGIPNKKWQWNYLTCPYKIFENQLKWIKKKGFNTISLHQLYDYMKEDIDLPKNPIVFTFDDGYLDNWVFAYPLLKKYGFKGTIYVNPEFVNPKTYNRKNIKDVWEKILDINELETEGYLSWGEMIEMENDEIIDIQSHTMTHTWYPTSNKIIDFRHPGDVYIWKTWNDNPNEKAYLQIDNWELVNYGEPIYESGRAIGIKRFFPDENFKNFMIDYVKEKGYKDFFQLPNWRDELFKVARTYKEKKYINERFETDEEFKKRLNYELKKSKEIIEKELNKEVRFLCWPGGAVSTSALKIASDIGYLSSTAGKDMKHIRKKLKNKYKEDPSRINRIGVSLYWNEIEGFRSKIIYKNGFYLLLALYRFQDMKIIAPLASLFLKGLLIIYRLKHEIFKRNKKYMEG